MAASTETLDFEALNKNIHHAVLCLEALTKHDGFDEKNITTLAAAVVKAKAGANAYMIGVIEAAEEESADANDLSRSVQ
jgi:hypothetical protein